MIPCYLALGSNLQQPKQQIRRAIHALQTIPCSRLVQVAPSYQSRPAGTLIQPIYYNTVALLKTRLPAHKVLYFCQAIEKQQKRTRLQRSNARTIDIDILLYGTHTINSPNLTVPHPRMHLRDFVLTPLLDLWPDATLPDGTKLTQQFEQLAQHHVILK